MTKATSRALVERRWPRDVGGSKTHRLDAAGMAANFLDVGGGANQQQIEHALRRRFSCQTGTCRRCSSILFAESAPVDTLASGHAQAAKRNLNVKVPVIALQSWKETNVEGGRRILKESGLKIHCGRHDAGCCAEGGGGGEKGAAWGSAVLLDTKSTPHQ